MPTRRQRGCGGADIDVLASRSPCGPAERELFPQQRLNNVSDLFDCLTGWVLAMVSRI